LSCKKITEGETTDGKFDAEKVKSELLDSKRGPRGPYTTMDAAEIDILQTSLNNAPVDMKFWGYKNVDEYSKISYIACTRFIVAIYEDKYGVRHEYYESRNTEDKRRPHINVIPGTSVTPEMFSDLAVDRYMVMVPNNRESIRMSIDKFISCTNTRLNWLRKGVELLTPIYNLLKAKILKVGSVLNIDETWTRVRIKFKGDKTKLGKY
jgi:transposase